jgi:hypothetical protein
MMGFWYNIVQGTCQLLTGKPRKLVRNNDTGEYLVKNEFPRYQKPLTKDAQLWHAASVECAICTHKWVAVWPVGTDKLECPNCSNLSDPIIHEA